MLANVYFLNFVEVGVLLFLELSTKYLIWQEMVLIMWVSVYHYGQWLIFFRTMFDF